MIATPTRATPDDLYGVEGKAELIGGRVVRFIASGHLPSLVASEIFIALRAYARSRGVGSAYPDGMGFVVPELSSGRESFSPDASYYIGPLPTNPMRFVEGPPTLAVEVRRENDYGPAAELEMAAKRADYFQAGTGVFGDVDPLAQSVTVYRASASDPPVTYRLGDQAEAEPAAPGWTVSVDVIIAG
jgi:Uma2 family endonuclease